MNKLQLTDFFEFYPDQNDRDIQAIFGSKKEFSDYPFEVISGLPETGTYFSHQIGVQHLLRTYPKIALIHETGMGKSCSVVAAAEYFKEHPEENIDKTVVIVRGGSLSEEFKKQLAFRCTNGVYNNKEYMDEPNKKRAAKILGNNIESFYDITTYQAISTDIDKLTDKQLIEKYSNKFFFIDEVHNLKNPRVTKDKKTWISIHRLLPRRFSDYSIWKE